MKMNIQEVFVALLVCGAVVSGQQTCTPDTAESGENSLCGSNNLQMFFSKSGGKIRVYRGTGKAAKDSEITVFIDSVKELDVDGNSIKGSNKHAIENFNSKMEFTTTVSNNVSVQYTGSPAVTADCLVSSGSLSISDGSISMTLSVCAIKLDGTLTMDGETTTLKAGQLKFSLNVTSWLWDNTGKTLEVAINFKVPPGRSVTKNSTQTGNKPVKFSLGGDAATEFSTKVFADNAWSTMQTNYPLYSASGANNYISIRLPRFNTSALYDPTIEPGAAPVGSASMASAIGQVWLAICVLFVTAFVQH